MKKGEVRKIKVYPLEEVIKERYSREIEVIEISTTKNA